MSLKSWTWAAKQVCGGPLEKFVLLALCDSHSGAEARSIFHQGFLAKECEMTKEQLWSVLRNLEKANLIKISEVVEDDFQFEPQEYATDYFAFEIPLCGDFEADK